jgi:hypothetical protein
MSRDDYTVQEFQRRRRQAWKEARPWVSLFIIAVIASYLIGDPKGGSWLLWTAALFVFAGIVLSIVRTLMIIGERYRCPGCGRTPMFGSASVGSAGIGYSRDVDLNPSRCSRCGAKLK